jgi:hypothetical protein
MPTSILTFSEADHAYRLDGQLLPSVTQVLSGVGLIDVRWFSDAAAWRGSVVHRICQFDDEGCLKESSVDPGAAGYLAAWRAAKRDLRMEILQIEQRQYHSLLRYAGTPDRIVRLANGDLAIIDLKTGAAAKWHPVQLVGYSNFFQLARRYRRFTVRLSADGRYVATEYFAATYNHDWSAFQGALALHNWRTLYAR